MNHIYRLRWNPSLARWIVTSELARRATGGRGSRRATTRRVRPAAAAILVSLLAASLGCDIALSAPAAGQITAGSGQITQSGNTTIIQQNSQNLSLNWHSFDIGSQETVSFVQPNATSLAVNRISSASASEILGHLRSNGQVWLINPNGVLFGEHAQVNVGGLVASTLDAVGDNSSGSQKFSGTNHAAVVNQGTITAASGGYVALLGHRVSNQGVISAQLGTVALGAGSAQTLTFNGNHLVHLQVDASQLNDLVENRQLIQANGGQVFMTAGAKNAVLASVVNNTGTVQAETVENHNGTIVLLGGGAGTVTVDGTLDASAPHGGDGGSIETSGATVNIAAAAKVRASAQSGRSGTWLIDPEDLTIDTSAATAIGQSLDSGTSVAEQTTSTTASGTGQRTSGLGDITVASDITWSNAAATLTLDAYHAINVNAPVTGGGQVVMTARGGDLTLNSPVSGQAGVTLSTAGNFINSAGPTAVSAGSGARWLVYSTTPTLDTAGGLAPDFIQYAAPANTTPTPSTGSGFLYSVAPGVTVTGLIGTITKTYDGTTSATIAGSNATVTGLLNGDSVTSIAGTYGSADAGSGITVSSSTDTTTLVVANGSIPVYGYGLTNSSATAAVGVISAKQLTASIVGTPTKRYDGTTTATLTSSNYNFDGLVAGQSATVSQPSTVGFASAEASQSAVVDATFASTNFTAGSGTNLANYILPTTATGPGVINPAPVNLTGLLALDKTYDTTNAVLLNTSNANIFGVIAPDTGSVSLDKSGAAATFAQSNAGNNIAVTVTPGSFQLTGSKAADYVLIAPADLTANIARKGLSLSGVAGTNKVYDGNTSDGLDFSHATLIGVFSADTANVGVSTAGASGSFISADAANGIAVNVSGVALTGTAIGNYSISQPTGVVANIAPKALNIALGGNQVKPYNGTRTATAEGTDFTITGFVGTDNAAVTQNALAQYSTPNAGTNIPLTATLEASDFTPASGTLMSNYSFPHTVTGNTGTINAIPLSAYITNNPTKPYDGNTNATVTSGDYVLKGFVGSESATITQPTATYAAPDAGAETVTASVTSTNYTAGSGTLLSNYILPTSISGAGTILPAQLSGNHINGSIVGNPTKTYDGTTVATLGPSNFQLTGFVSGQGATVTQTVGEYSNANVGSQTVTAHLGAGDFTADAGTNLANYVLPTVVYGPGTINPATLAVSIVGNPTKVYDGTTVTALLPSNYQVTGFVSGEGAVITPSALINYDSKDVGTHTITANLTASAYTPDAGTLMSNYTLATSATGPGQITAAPLYVIGVAANNRSYNGTTAASLNISNAGLGGLVTGESALVTLNTTTSGTFTQADVANGIAVSTTGFSISGAGASNYTLQPVTGLRANITPAQLTIQQVTANDKPYDSTTGATLSTGSAALQGLFNSDDVTLVSSGATGSFASANAGSGIPVTASGFTIGGTKAFDYSLSQPTGLTASINPAVITATIIGNPTKSYDGSNSATLTDADYQLSGFAPNQGATVPQSATANYLTPDAGNHIGLGSTLVISDFLPNAGTNLANYVMPSTASGSLGTITPKILNLTGTRVYDTTTDANGALFGTLSGLNGDTLAVTGSGTLVSKNVGTQNFSSQGTLSLNANGGATATNYTLVGGTDWVKITPAPLTVSGATGHDKVYDGNTSAVVSGATLNGVLGSDSVTLGNDASGHFDDKNVGTTKTIVTAMAVTGADAGNYSLAQPSNVTGNITASHITVTATGQNKQYDATTSDNPILNSAGVIAGDSVSFTGSASFDTADVGTSKAVSVLSIASAGTDAHNYILDNSTASTTADITPRVLNLSGTRVYDATTNAYAILFGNGDGTIAGVAGQTLTLTGTGALSSKNVNSAQTFASFGTLALGDGTNGGLGSNYTLLGGTDRVNITPAQLTVINTAVTPKTYDGTAAADLTGATLQGVLGSDHVSLGNASTGTFSDKNIGVNKAVTTAMTIGDTDGGNYTLTQPTLLGTISSKTITVTAAGVDKYYDGSTVATVNLGSSQLAPGDNITFTDTSAAFASKDAAAGISIDVQGIQAAGTGAGNYTLANGTATTSATIKPKVINLIGTRVYDNGLDADASLFAPGGVLTTGIGTEALTLTGSGVLSSKNVNAAQPFSLGTLSMADGTSGGLANNYTFATGTDKVNVTPLHITVTASGAAKTYDGGLNDPGLTLASTGIYAGNSVNILDTAAHFGDKNVQTGKTVTVTGIHLSGSDAGNYHVDDTSTTTTADITPKTLTTTAIAGSRDYDGTNTATVTSLTAQTGGIVSGDHVTIGSSGATFSDANAATNKTVTVAGLNLTDSDAANYVLSSPTATTTATISPLSLNLIGTRVYDDDVDANTSLFAPGGVLSTGIGNETLVLSGVGTLDSKNVNSAQTFNSLGTLSLADGTNGGLSNNYTLANGTDRVNITPLHITVTATGANKVYDGAVNDPGLALGSAGIYASDHVTFADTSATFADKLAQDGKTVTVGGISISGGADANNYFADNAVATALADISRKPITVAATGTSRTYDTTTHDAVSLSSGQIVAGDDVTFSAGSSVFGDKTVGNGKTVSISGITASGNDAGNYTFSHSTTTTADITPAALTVTNTQATGKTYDSSNLASLSGATLVGVLGNDDVALGNYASGAFSDPNAGSTKAVTTAMTVTGGDSSNYTFTQPTGLTADISRAILNLTSSRQYDGTVNAAATLFGTSGVLNGVNGETLTLSGTGTLTSKNVNPAQTFAAVNGFNLVGNGAALASNYTLAGGTDWVAITPAPLVVVGTQASDKIYDGTALATLTGATLSGVMGGDDVSLGNRGIGAFADKNVGGAKVVSTAMTVSGNDVGNYAFSQPTGLNASITQRSATIAAGGIDKVYDGNTLDQVTLSTMGLIAGDDVSVTNTSAVFGDKNVGRGKTVLVGGIALHGTDAGNYSYNTSTTTAANITPRVVTVAAAASDKVYDGNTNDSGVTLAATGILAGDDVSFAHTAATFGDKDVGNGKNVTVTGISDAGADAGNYAYNSQAAAKANITPAPLTVMGTQAASRAYDGTVNDALSGATLAGLISGDSVLLGNSAAGIFSDRNVGTGKTVTTAMTISGVDAGNYALAQPIGLAADVTAKTIAVRATGTNKVYDGKTGDKVILTSDGIVDGDSVAFSNSGADFSSATVGKGKTVTVTGLQANGPDAGNYALASNTVNTTADIATGTGIQDTAVAVGYLELSPTAVATPYGVAPADSPGQLTGNRKLLHRVVEANVSRVDFGSGLSLQVVDGGVRVPAQ
ncbi:MAG TPA: YDG domain-containing protein [Steroidobacteraceae bacterium]|jgi:filamentous hemagglutinin family protein